MYPGIYGPYSRIPGVKLVRSNVHTLSLPLMYMCGSLLRQHTIRPAVVQWPRLFSRRSLDVAHLALK